MREISLISDCILELPERESSATESLLRFIYNQSKFFGLRPYLS